jgi:serine/threonine protein kinase
LRNGDLTGYSLGDYVLRDLLGRGAVGSVYRAYQPGLKRYVAIKVLTPTPDEPPSALAERFALEAHTFASLEHPHIVPIFDYGIHDGLRYIVMRLLTGGTLEDRLRQRLTHGKRLPSLGEVSHMLNQIADALTYAHERSVIHRDVKSGNVMFDERGRAYLVDFSIVKLLDDGRNLTADGLIVGTPALMPPEQWRGEALTPAADQYALGVVVYQLVTGRLPLEAATTPALMYRHLNDIPAPAHEVRPDVPEAVSRVLAWALAKDPAERYPSARLFAQAFAEAIEGVEGKTTEFFTFPLTTPAAAPEAPVAPPGSVTRDVSDLPTLAQAVPQPTLITSLPAPPPPPDAYATLYGASLSRPVSRSRWLPALAGIGFGLLVAALCLGLIWITASALLNAGGSPTTDVVGLFASTPTLRPMSTADDISPEITAPVFPTDSAAPDPSQRAVSTADALTPQGGESVGWGAGEPDTLTSNASESISTLGGWQAGEVIWTVDTSVRSVAFAEGGAQIVYAGNSDSVQRAYSGEGRDGGVLYVHGDTVYSLDVYGSKIISGDGAGTIRLWDAGRIIATLSAHTGAVRHVTFNPEGTLFASVGEDGAIHLWDGATGAAVAQFTLPNRVLAAAFSPDGATLATSGMGTEIALWDVAEGNQRAVLSGHPGEVRALDYSPDGARLASGGSDGSVRLWDTVTGTLVDTLNGHTREIFSVAFSADGALLASGSADARVLVWSMATGAPVSELSGHGGWVFDVEFAADGFTIASAGGDGTVRLWIRTN